VDKMFDFIQVSTISLREKRRTSFAVRRSQAPAHNHPKRRA
jgi:hypothetical protein